MTSPTETPEVQADPVIDPRTHLDHVHLVVRDLSKVLPFYTDIIGLKVHRRDGSFAALGAGAHDLIRLTQDPDAPSGERTAGMYHFSLLVKERADLARWLRRIAQTKTPVEGLVHHAPAAEAIYLPDPEGNTVELNWDPPREVWSRVSQEGFRGNLPLDTDALFGLIEGEDDASWQGAPPDTTFSHIHLYVGDLHSAARFYKGVIGFEQVTEFRGQAMFVSAGGYHHHVAFNLWKGRGIPPQPRGAAGLKYYVVQTPEPAELDRVLGRVRAAGLPLEESEAGLLVRDPAGLGVVLTAAG
ncbi:MAG TPA: VOC family protein [Chloroflexota bacterium]|nr:VOC family protein [Chloroflexota bacterium]